MASASRRILVNVNCGTVRGLGHTVKHHYSENPMEIPRRPVGRVLTAPRPFWQTEKFTLNAGPAADIRRSYCPKRS